MTWPHQVREMERIFKAHQTQDVFSGDSGDDDDDAAVILLGQGGGRQQSGGQ